MRRTRVAGSLVVALLVSSLSVASPDRIAAQVDDPSIGTCPTFEAPVDGVPAVANPFDPAEVDVQVTFTAPSGTTSTTAAFFTQDYTRALVGQREQLNATGSGHWRVRYTPTEPGDWSWISSVSIDGGKPTISPPETFTCELDASSHGFLRRSPDDSRHLQWDDGSPYTAIGENLSWYDQRGTFAYDTWLDRLAAHDATWIRLWMPTWAFSLETLTRGAGGVIVQNSLGNYTTRLDKAWQLDYVIEAARARGIVVQLVLQNHGPFSVDHNAEWDNNPYNASNGGPLTDPTQFFTNNTAKELFERRMRYIVARWGYATNLVWEFWNEVDLTNAAPADVIAWHADMGDRLRALDPYDHLQTTSVDGQLLGNPTAWVPLFELAQIDLSQLHFYGIGNAAPLDFTTFLPIFVAPLLALDKPMLVAEAGVDFRGPAETIAADPDGQGFHELLWTGLFSGGYGSGMTWWWDNVVDPLDQYDTLDGLNVLTSGVAFDQENFVRDGATAATVDGTPLEVFPLRGRRTSLIWVRNDANWWHQPDFTSITGATLTVDGLIDGEWRVEWVDPYSGAVTDGGVLSVRGGDTSVALPTFSGELAARMTLVEAQTSFVECDQIAGEGKIKPSLTNLVEPVTVSAKSSLVGSCSGALVSETGPLTSIKGKAIGSMSCDATMSDPARPLAGKLELLWTALDAKGKAVKSSTFVRMEKTPGIPDAVNIDNGIVTKGPGVGMDVSGGFLYQPTEKKLTDVSTIDPTGNIVPGSASLTLLANCLAGAGGVDSFVFGTDGTSLAGPGFDSGISFALPT